jgi:hypothetical protein
MQKMYLVLKHAEDRKKHVARYATMNFPADFVPGDATSAWLSFYITTITN